MTNRSPNFVPKNLFFQLLLKDHVVQFIIEVMEGGIWLWKTKQGLGQKVKREQNNHSKHNYICQPTLKMNLCKKITPTETNLKSNPNIFKYLNKSISSMSEKITHKRQPVEKRQHNPSTNCLDTRTWHLSIYKLTNISPAWPRATWHRPKQLFSFSVLELSQPGPAGSSRPTQPDARPPDGQPWSAQHVRRQQ